MNDMNEHEEKVNETLTKIESILQQESNINNYLISAKSTQGAVMLSCKGDEIDSLISNVLEIMHNQNPDMARRSITSLLMRVADWYSLYHDKKRTLH